MDHITVGELRRRIADLPDDMPVLSVANHDDAHRVNTVHLDIVKETRPRSGVFETFLTPEEFAADHCDENGKVLPNSLCTEKDRPPADGVLALTLWH